VSAIASSSRSTLAPEGLTRALQGLCTKGLRRLRRLRCMCTHREAINTVMMGERLSRSVRWCGIIAASRRSGDQVLYGVCRSRYSGRRGYRAPYVAPIEGRTGIATATRSETSLLKWCFLRRTRNRGEHEGHTN
jgi:hypothetical protein